MFKSTFGFERIFLDDRRSGWSVKVMYAYVDGFTAIGKGRTEISALRNAVSHIRQEIKRSERVIRGKKGMMRKLQTELRRGSK